jgi:hypothetical protein
VESFSRHCSVAVLHLSQSSCSIADMTVSRMETRRCGLNFRHSVEIRDRVRRGMLLQSSRNKRMWGTRRETHARRHGPGSIYDSFSMDLSLASISSFAMPAIASLYDLFWPASRGRYLVVFVPRWSTFVST